MASDDRERRPRRTTTPIAHGATILVATATLANLCAGMLAILLAMLAIAGTEPAGPGGRADRLLHIGCALVLTAMLFDGLDGHLARVMRRSSEFGRRLDSLADLVSFGVAPAILLLVHPVTRMHTAGLPGNASAGLVELFVVVACAMMFTVCAAIRLARHGTESVEHRPAPAVRGRGAPAANAGCTLVTGASFRGLPAPGAGLIVVALLLQGTGAGAILNAGAPGLPAVGPCWVGAAAALTALLMVSRIEYPHVVVALSRGRPWAAPFAALALGGVLLWQWPTSGLLGIATIYTLSGPVLLWRRAWGARAGDGQEEIPVLEGVDERVDGGYRV